MIEAMAGKTERESKRIEDLSGLSVHLIHKKISVHILKTKTNEKKVCTHKLIAKF